MQNVNVIIDRLPLIHFLRDAQVLSRLFLWLSVTNSHIHWSALYVISTISSLKYMKAQEKRRVLEV